MKELFLKDVRTQIDLQAFLPLLMDLGAMAGNTTSGLCYGLKSVLQLLHNKTKNHTDSANRKESVELMIS